MEFLIENNILKKCIGNDKEAVIPEGVTNIDRFAFADCTKLVNLSIPNSLIDFSNIFLPESINLEFNIFDNAKYLGNRENPYLILFQAIDKKIDTCLINENTKIISSFAFSKCLKLTNIIIPSNVISFGDYIFDNCENLIYNEFDNAKYLGNNENPYYCLVKAKDKGIKNCVINSQTKFILNNAFFYSTYLEKIEIPNGVISIGNNSFLYCEKICEIDIPSSVTNLGTDVFCGCSSLNKINIPESITRIERFTFKNCNSLSEIVIPSNIKFIGVKAFFNCSGFKSLTIPDNVTEISDKAFSDCDGLTKIVLSKNIISIGERAFDNCNNLKEVYFSGTIEDWSKINFKNGSSNPMFFAKHFYSLGEDGTYSEANDLILPNNLKAVNDYSFCAFNKLTNITIPESVKSIGCGAFYSCKKLINVSMPQKLTQISDMVFYNCNNLSSILIPTNAKTIGKYAFYNCSKLSTIIIPSSVIKIDVKAFSACENLKNVTFKNTIGWKVNDNKILDSDLEDSSIAAKYLVSTYTDSVWTCKN